MDARRAFWNCYTEMKYREYYLLGYKEMVVWRERLLTWFVAIASSAFVTTLALWTKYPFLWVLITIAVQIVGVVRPSFNYSKIEYSINLAMPDIQRITVVMEREWIFMDEEPDKTIAESKLSYTQSYYDIDNKYLLSLNLSPSSKIAERAMASRDNYIRAHFNTEYQEETP